MQLGDENEVESLGKQTTSHKIQRNTPNRKEAINDNVQCEVRYF